MALLVIPFLSTPALAGQPDIYFYCGTGSLTMTGICLLMGPSAAIAEAPTGSDQCKQAIEPLIEQAQSGNDGLAIAMLGAAAAMLAATGGSQSEAPKETPAAAVAPVAPPATLVAQPEDKKVVAPPIAPGNDTIKVGFGSSPPVDPKKTPGSDRVVAQPDADKRPALDQLRAGAESGGGSPGGGGGSSGGAGSIAGGGAQIGNDQLSYATAALEGYRDPRSIGSLATGEGGGGSGGPSGESTITSSELPGAADQRLFAERTEGRAPAADTGAAPKGDVAQKFGPSIFRINSAVVKKFSLRHNLQ